MKLSAFLLLALISLTVSCGGGSTTAPNAPNDGGESARTETLPSDEYIIGKVYDADYSVPDGFFVDERASTAQSYTVHHVMDESGSFELCTDDFDIAAAWESADDASRNVNGYYVGAHENDRYFEFIRELSYDNDIGNIEDLTSPGFARVFKCSNTNRDGVDRSSLSGYAGTLNVRPLAEPEVRGFAEYLWQFTFFPQRHKKVLASHSAISPGGPGHTLQLAFASRQGNGLCDLIEVVEWRFIADASTGGLHTEFDTLRQFEAEIVDGSPRLCP